MKKLLFVNNNMKVGGVQKSLYNLLWALDARGGYDVTLLLFSKTGVYLESLPQSVRVVECGGPFRYLGKSQGEYKNCRKEALCRGLLAGIARLWGRQTAIRFMRWRQPIWDAYYDCAISFLHNGREKAFYGGAQDFVIHCVKAQRKVAFLHGDYKQCGANHRANNRMMEQFDCIAACSEGCCHSLVEALPHLEQRCITVPNCHRFDEMARLATIDIPVLDEERVHAVMVARLTHEKGIDRALKAVAYTIEAGVPLQLHMVGDGPLRNTLQQQAIQLGVTDAVCFYGEQSNPYPYMQAAHLLLMTSYHEAAPMVIDEAVSLGVPVLTTETSSSQEMVAERQAGWVCANTQEAINEALCRIAADRSSLEAVRNRLKAVPLNNERALSRFDRVVGDAGY